MVSAAELQKQANANRRAIVDMIHTANAGHPGGSLSVIDVLTAIYATDVDFSQKPRSRVILSKGHAVPAQYAVLHSYGILSDDEMKTLRRMDSRLQGHPCTHRLPEVDATTGLLGQGLSLGIGMAIAKRGSSRAGGPLCPGQPDLRRRPERPVLLRHYERSDEQPEPAGKIHGLRLAG